MTTNNKDMVNHPSHYNIKGVECIDLLLEIMGIDEVMCHCKCSAFEYLLRHHRKGGNEDIQKANWWLNKWNELNERKAKNEE